MFSLCEERKQLDSLTELALCLHTYLNLPLYSCCEIVQKFLHCKPMFVSYLCAFAEFSICLMCGMRYTWSMLK